MFLLQRETHDAERIRIADLVMPLKSRDLDYLQPRPTLLFFLSDIFLLTLFCGFVTKRETRDAERVRMADLVRSLKAEMEELQRRPITEEAALQTVLTENDMRENEAITLRLLEAKKVQQIPPPSPKRTHVSVCLASLHHCGFKARQDAPATIAAALCGHFFSDPAGSSTTDQVTNVGF